MPKEQLTNFRFVSPQCDVWSMGAIFYECLTLKLPRVHQKGTDPIRTILHAELVPLNKVLPEATPELVAFSNKCLDNEPTNRFANAAEMRQNLKLVATKLGIDL
jgi:serine/threonine-protein kinase